MNYEKTPTEVDLINALKRGELSFPPLEVSEVREERTAGDARIDAVLGFRWRGREYRFGVECKRLWTPKVIQEAAFAAKRYSEASKLNPLVLTPYLTEKHLSFLEEQGVSGLDLCGNGVINVPNELLVYRTGAPNRFAPDGEIKNVYRRTSSVAARAFLLRPEYGSVGSLREEICRRGATVTLGTVSKVCAKLDSDLVIARERDAKKRTRRLRLLQPEKLLDLLTENYVPPDITRTFSGKTDLTPEGFREALSWWSGGRVVRTGESSAEAYAVMAREPVQSFYCTDIQALLADPELGSLVREGERFANVRLLEARDESVYFDRRRPGLAASPVQVLLELAAGDKRERETAEQVRRLILDGLRKQPPTGDSHG